MQSLKYWKEKIKEKRKNTDFRDFLMEIASWTPVVFSKNNGLISRFPKSNRVNVISLLKFEESRDDLFKSGLEYDYNKDFFKNFGDLLLNTSLPNMFHYGINENSEYSDIVAESKNCYLSVSVTVENENIFYSFGVRVGVSTAYNSIFIANHSEIIYFSRYINNSFKVFYSGYINNSSNIWFSSNLIGCKECIFCDNLENTSYAISNKVLGKEEYFKQKKEILKEKSRFLEYYSKIDNIGNNHNNINSNGSFISDSENIENGNFVFNTKNARNLFLVGSPEGCEDMYDTFIGGSRGSKDFYGVGIAGVADNLYNVTNSGYSSNLFYSCFMDSCSFCLGCIGLKNKSYCILNKQYTKQEWEILSDKIFKQMNNDSILGDFFPGKLNPFNFNDTAAHLIGNFTKKEIDKKGYMWREEEIKVDIPEGAKIISTDDLDNYQAYDLDGNWKINPKILNVVIKDKNGNYYRIIKQEYDFLLKYGLPLPNIHWMDRMRLNFGV